MPSGIDRMTANRVDIRAICSDTWKRTAISSETGLPVHIEVPKSPTNQPPTHWKNCRKIGSSNPSSRRQISSERRSKNAPEPASFHWQTSTDEHTSQPPHLQPL